MEERIIKQFEEWLTNPYFDDSTKQELLSIRNNEGEIEERFYKDLEFGTGGMRGIIGAGTNRMNIYTVRKVSQGLANYILKHGEPSRGVAISYDSRNFSDVFANEAALTLAANGIKAYVSDQLRAVPQLSFSVRHFGCQAGIEITASHNPPEYNGYKVYWEDGAQVLPPHDTGIVAEVAAIRSYDEVKHMDREAAIAAGLYVSFGTEVDDVYMGELKKLSIHPEIIKEMAEDIKIVYTPFHGTGHVPVMRVLKELGFRQVYEVPEQALPDGNFTTLAYPNPEDPKAFTLALALAKEKNADVILATDPDADRLGVYAKDSRTGEYMGFTGNMSGMLIAEYIFRERKATGTLPENPAFISTIVTTKLGRAIAEKYNAYYKEVLTGFKYIGEQIRTFEANGEHNYVFGLEESYGCLPGTHARDKDAIAAVMMLCEAAAWCRKNGMTLYDQMMKIYEEYGYYCDTQFSLTMPGIEGAEKIKALMKGLREDPEKEIAGRTVLEFRDYSRDYSRNMLTGEEGTTGLPASNVLFYQLDNDAWTCIRPSGTEPKVKFYIGTKGGSMEDARSQNERITAAMKKLADN